MKLSAIAGVAAIGLASLLGSHHNHLAYRATTPPPIRTATAPGGMEYAYAAVISADVASTVPMPDGSVLWLTGDAALINGQVVWDPHSEFVRQAAPGSTDFTVLRTVAGNGVQAGQWQQVPNWSDGTVFWMAAGAVDNGVLHVFGARVNLANGGTVVGYYDATFDATTLSYQGIAAIPAGVSAIAQGTGGWWLIGTDHVSGSCPYGDCYTAHSIWAATGSLGNYASWTAPYTFLPASDGLGGVVDLYRTSTGLWTAWTKTDDILGSTIEEYTAPHLEVGPWTLKNTWPIPTTCGAGTSEGDCTSGWMHPLPTTYGVRFHPNQSQPTGDGLVTVIENDANAYPPVNGSYGPHFLSLPTG